IVVFTGDLMDNASNFNEKEKISKVLGKIESNIGKYAVYGNRDYGGGAVRVYRSMMEESGFKVLSNQSESITFNNKKINIFGGDDALIGEHDAKRTIKGIKNEDVNILLLHEPDLIEEYAKYPIDLALAGHSHGGQVYLPFYGPIKKNVLSENYYRGMYDIENKRGTKLYVNTGLGNTKVPFRFLNIPEITVFNMRI
ncbi:MAG: metallophosphoesterase, partial [Clostridium sp.]